METLLKNEVGLFGRRRSLLRVRGQRGFTLIELMIVLSIIIILVGIAVGSYRESVRRAREAVLKQDLQTMRQAIDNFTMDKQQAPQSLDDLVTAHYLREIPIDPVCQQIDWNPHFGDTVLSPEQTTVGMDDIFSGCDQVGSNGASYTTW
ncbi:MAG TPA: prepilin-type N-terminal cleavage/methylation domain-containing protein [Candidatus Acidoferrum sp.]|jgi:general secretion pathway protein G